MSNLSILMQVVAANDAVGSNNPVRTPINWKRSFFGLPCEIPSSEEAFLDPGVPLTFLDGTRTTTIDGTTTFSLSLSPADSTHYRITATSGTAPGFRTARGLSVSGTALTLVVGANLTLTVTAGSGTPFASVVAGDDVFVPGVSTGDPASPFNPLNEGYWYVLTTSGTVLVLSRAPGTVFAGISEVVTPSSNTYFQAFSASGVQVGDTVDLIQGFAASALHTYEVVAVNPSWVEFVSTLPLGAQTGIVPTAAGVIVYVSAKRLILIETDQELQLQFNGDTGVGTTVEPLVPGDDNFPGIFLQTTTCWKLVLTNTSSYRAKVLIGTAE